MLITDIAAICHEANREYCRSLGDCSQPFWPNAPVWQQQSAIKGVLFCLNYPDAPPSANHDSWLKEKYENGWKYGDIKDAEKKEHPCCVPYDELPQEQKAKDLLFKNIVASLAHLVKD